MVPTIRRRPAKPSSPSPINLLSAEAKLPLLRSQPRYQTLRGSIQALDALALSLSHTSPCCQKLLFVRRVNLNVMEMSLRHFSKLVSPGYRVRVCITPRALLACFLSFTTFLSLGLEIPAATAAADKKPKQDPLLKGLPITELTADEAILHALNRLAYGPRPGDIERIKQIGLAKWIDQQLNPNSINDSAVEARLEIYPTLKMHTAQLLSEYPNPKQAAKQELKAQNQNANAPGADPAINSMAQEIDSSSPAAKTADSPGAAMSASTADAPSPMKLNPPTRAPSQKDPLAMAPNPLPTPISHHSQRPRPLISKLAMAKTLRAI